MEKFTVSMPDNRLVLTAAVLLYSLKRHAGGDTPGIATVHHVKGADGGRPVIEAGRPMTVQDFTAMINVLKPTERPQVQWQDQRILAQGLGKLIWWNPPMQRPMFFNCKSKNSAPEFIAQGMCELPGLIWMRDKLSLSVFAYRGNAVPRKETRLCQAPFLNVYSNGVICLGSAVKPDELSGDDPTAWEKSFFESAFSHPIASAEKRLTKGMAPVEFWRDMLVTKPTTFPESVLFDLDAVVGDLLALDFPKGDIPTMRGAAV